MSHPDSRPPTSRGRITERTVSVLMHAVDALRRHVKRWPARYVEMRVGALGGENDGDERGR